MKKKIAMNRDLFTHTITPPEKLAQMTCVNIYEDGKFNMNGRLANKLGGKSLEIAFTEDGVHFMLMETTVSDFTVCFPKNGSRKLPDVIEHLKKQKIMLPARYEVWLTDEGHWQGDLLENPTPLQSGKHHNSKKS